MILLPLRSLLPKIPFRKGSESQDLRYHVSGRDRVLDDCKTSLLFFRINNNVYELLNHFFLIQKI